MTDLNENLEERLEDGFTLLNLLDAERPADFDWDCFQPIILEDEDEEEVLREPLKEQIVGMF